MHVHFHNIELCGCEITVAYPVRMAAEEISIQMSAVVMKMTSSIRRVHGVGTKIGRLRKHSVLKSDWFSVIFTIKREY